MKVDTKFLEGYNAVRNSVALEEESDIRCILITGDSAFKVLDRICPCDIYLYNGQIKHTILLEENGIPFADIYACRDGENAYVLGYGPESAYLIEWIKKQTKSINSYTIDDVMKSHSAITMNGPYAWELVAEVVGPEILGMPYLSMISLDKIIVFRAGMTGEYGYHIMIPYGDKERLISAMLEKGSSYDIKRIDNLVRLHCSMENFFFDIKKEGGYGLNPMELQLQWRLSSQKMEYPGAEAINEIRKTGWRQRITCFRTNLALKVGEEILCDKESVGKVLSVGYSPLLDAYLGKALIQKPYWQPGLDCFQVGSGSLSTISAPAIDNLSINVNPYIDSYFNRQVN